MDTRLKHRLVGTAVVVALAIIFLPELLRPAVERRPVVEDLDLPPRPVHSFEPTPGEPLVQVPSAESAPTPSVIVDPTPPPATPVVPVENSELLVKQEPQLRDEPADAEISAVAPGSDGLPEISPELRAWVVQVGSFSEERNADALRDKLRDANFTAFVEPAKVGDRQMYRVRVGPELEKRVAEKLKVEIQEQLQIAGQLRRYP